MLKFTWALFMACNVKVRSLLQKEPSNSFDSFVKYQLIDYYLVLTNRIKPPLLKLKFDCGEQLNFG